MLNALRYFVCAICALLAVNVPHLSALAQASVSNEGQKRYERLEPADITALSDLLRKNFRRLRKLDTIPLAVVDDGKDLDVTRWPGRLVLDDIRSDELKCGVKYRIVSQHDYYRALLVLGNFASGKPIEGEDDRRNKIRSEFRALLGPQGQLISGVTSPDAVYPIYLIDAPVYVQQGAEIVPYDHVLLPPPYVRITVWDWDDRVKALKQSLPSDPYTYAQLKDKLSALLASALFCPREFIDYSLASAGLDESPDSVLRLLSDARITVGMDADEFARATQKLLAAASTSK